MTTPPAAPPPPRSPARRKRPDGWSYKELGHEFRRKFLRLQQKASESERLSKKQAWSQLSIYSDAMGISLGQWSNVRSENPRGDAYLRTHQLAALARLFELDQALGVEAWKLFLPNVSFEAFDSALQKAVYGQDEQPRPRVRERYIIPELDEFILRCPATLEEYDQTVELTRDTFDQDLIDLEADREAFLKNPYPMIVLVDTETRDVLGWVDIYHLPEEDFERLIEVGDVNIDPSRLKSFPEFCSAERGYTASIRIAPKNPGLVRLLIYGMLEFMQKFQFVGTDSFELFAIGQTEKGESLLQFLEFSFVRSVQMEEGPCNLYARKFLKQELPRLKRQFARDFGIFRAAVRIEIDNPLDRPVSRFL